MKLSYIIPENTYSFFSQVIPVLKNSGIQVRVNEVDAQTDIILAGILPITHAWTGFLEITAKPVILWHWDLYSFTDYNTPHWKGYLGMLERAKEIWSCSYETARQLKERLEYDSVIIPAWVDCAELLTKPSSTPLQEIHGSVFYAAGGSSIGKRISWAEKACELLKIPFKVTRNQTLPRAEYLQWIHDCAVYVMPAFEESNGSIPAMEAAVVGKPLVMADLPSNREVFGDHPYYFSVYDFQAFLDKLRRAWQFRTESRQALSNRIIRNYGVVRIGQRMVERLYANLPTRPR